MAYVWNRVTQVLEIQFLTCRPGQVYQTRKTKLELKILFYTIHLPPCSWDSQVSLIPPSHVSEPSQGSSGFTWQKMAFQHYSTRLSNESQKHPYHPWCHHARPNRQESCLILASNLGFAILLILHRTSLAPNDSLLDISQAVSLYLKTTTVSGRNLYHWKLQLLKRRTAYSSSVLQVQYGFVSYSDQANSCWCLNLWYQNTLGRVESLMTSVEFLHWETKRLNCRNRVCNSLFLTVYRQKREDCKFLSSTL